MAKFWILVGFDASASPGTKSVPENILIQKKKLFLLYLHFLPVSSMKKKETHLFPGYRGFAIPIHRTTKSRGNSLTEIFVERLVTELLIQILHVYNLRIRRAIRSQSMNL
jgi:hypothetical protein